MILCDVGNTFFHFFQEGRIWKESFERLQTKAEDIFYISVNPLAEKKLCQYNQNAIDLAPYFSLETRYQGLGIDRIAACKSIFDGVVIDAGSAITIDVMQQGVHLGGYILPGVTSYIEMYKRISPALDVLPSLSTELNALPQNTKEALGYGMLKSIIGLIDEASKEKNIYFCGGDGKFFSKFFAKGIYDETLIFRGMEKALEHYYEKNS